MSINSQFECSKTKFEKDEKKNIETYLLSSSTAPTLRNIDSSDVQMVEVEPFLVASFQLIDDATFVEGVNKLFDDVVDDGVGDRELLELGDVADEAVAAAAAPVFA